MNSKNWLMIGGPAHGKIFWVKGGCSVLFHSGERYFSYVGNEYIHRGKRYLIGLCGDYGTDNATDCEIERLIDDTGMEAIQSNIQ